MFGWTGRPVHFRGPESNHYFGVEPGRIIQDIAEGKGDKAFLEDKIKTANFFYSHILPETTSLRYKVEAGADDVMALGAERF